MAPVPQENLNELHLKSRKKPLCGEEIVISGMSGLFPKSNNVSEFMDNLFNKVDMVTTALESIKHSEIPKHMGKISGAKKFDAQFFRVTYNQATFLDPATRKSLENAYAAIYDAGENPLIYKGKKIGVYTGSVYFDSAFINTYLCNTHNAFVLTGFSKCMMSNRISYFLDSKAQSVTVDCGCASSMECLKQAYNDIKSGICDAAVVGGCQMCFHHLLPLNIKKLGLLCLDGKTKCFDKNADGYVRSEAISFLFIQKAKYAKRVYAEICSVKTSYGLKPDAEFLPIRKQEEITGFLDTFYSEAGVSPNEVEYVEAHGAALPEGDTNELQAISEVFAKEKSVMVGCVKSNMGNSEPASSLCGITKLCLAYHKGILPPNLHYSKPLDISSINEGKVKILMDETPFNRGFTAINTFAYNGTNCHALLKGHYKPKHLKCYASNIPRLVFVSGRQDEGVVKIFDILKSQPIDPELIGLLHNIYQLDTPGHTCRGYTIIDTDDKKETVLLSESVQLYQRGRRPLCLVFSGMGSQWAGMGTELMRISIFAAAIEKSRKILEPKGIDIVRIITEPDACIFENIVNCFVGIAAIQIGLSDILKAMEIVPDYFLGHSLGELGCAYFDGAFTAEEMILVAYYRGLVSVEIEFIEGSMAAVNLGCKDVLSIIPPSIDIACHNSSESCTISGPADCVKSFVDDLKRKGIFAKKVATANIAYHSRYIQEAGPTLLKYLKEYANKLVPRSEKWICTSIPRENWDEPIAKFSSPEYHTNNFLSPVYFEEAAMLIPTDAVVVEVAPHGLLQAILKRSHPECVHIPLTKRDHSDPVKFLLESFGNLYTEGFNPKVDVLYPKIEYPVSTETPMISHFIEWYQQEDWATANFTNGKNIVSPMRRFVMSIQDDDYQFFAGHVIDGDILLPEAAVLFFLWDTFAMFKGVHHEDLSLIFHDVYFHGNVIIDPKKDLKLEFMITKGSRYFEVTWDKNIVASGYIEEDLKYICERDHIDPSGEDEGILMNTEDIYKVFQTKGYDFKNEFQSIKTSSNQWSAAEVKWTGNWITFLDSLIQLNILARNYDGVSAVKLLKYMKIDVNDHICKIKDIIDQDMSSFVQLDNQSGLTRCSGVEIQNITFDDMPVKDREPDVLQTMSFIPYCASIQIDLEEALQINLQLVAENTYENDINVVEVGILTKSKIREIIKSVLKNIPDVIFKVHALQAKDLKSTSKTNLLVAQNFLTDAVYDDIYKKIEKNTFILTFEKRNGSGVENNRKFNVITSMVVEGQTLVLLKKATNTSDPNITFISVTYDTQFLWVSRVQYELQKFRKVILVSEKQSLCGLFGLVKKLYKEYPAKIGLIVLDDNKARSWNPEKDIFKEQIQKNLVFNIFKQGQWGSYYYLPSRKSNLHRLTNFNLVTTVSGDMDSVKWVEAESYSQNVVQVCCAGPSLRDIQIAVGLTKTNMKGFGMDFSGLDTKGNRVMGLVNSGALSSSVEAVSDLLWPVPENWTLEEAATVPLPYIQALYCLTVKCQLLSRHSVFVSGGAGAVGQAVISICLGFGSTVYTSVGDINKKRFLMKLFPQLSENHIGYTYDGGFLTSIITNTKRKCDIVINCMSGVIREFAMNCVADFGVFLDLSTYDMKENKDFGMYYLKGAKNYKSVNLSNIFRQENANVRKVLQLYLTEGITNGIVKPLTYVLFSTDDVPRAFRFIATSKHRGRVLINIKESAESLGVVPRMEISSTGTYVVVCDETQLGIDLANRLVKQGARHITLHIKHKKTEGYLNFILAQWKNLDVSVSISREKLNTDISCLKVLGGKQVTGQVHGIFIIQECSQSGGCEQKDFVKNSNDTISVVTNLSLVSKTNCPGLRYFVIISRTTQNSVDEYTTSVLDQICKERARIDLPSLVFRVEISDKDQLAISNTIMQPLTITIALNGLESSLKQKYNNVLAYDVKRDASKEFLKKISKIIGFGNISDMDENLTLNNLVSNEVVIKEINHVIKENFGLDITKEAIKNMTLDRLRNLTMGAKANTKFESGMGAFYNFIDEDEIAATQVLIPMSTSSEFTENELYLDTNGTYLMLIPGFEGHHHIFKTLCERIKIGAVALQLRPNMSDSSIQEIAADIKSHILKIFAMKSKFYLLGYSFGVNVALEVAALFEKDGLTGVVYCLDSSPEVLRIQLNAYLGHLSEQQLQNTIIEHLFYIMSGQANVQLNQELKEIKDWPVKIDVCLKYLQKLVSHSFEYCKDVLEAAYKRIALARNYKPNFRLESELVLLKGIPHPDASLPFDYNLSKYSKKAVKVYEISSDVATATEDCKVAIIVNRFLDPKLLEEFKRKNLCVSYSTNMYENN